MIYLLLGLGLKLVYKCVGASLEAHGRRDVQRRDGVMQIWGHQLQEPVSEMGHLVKPKLNME